MTQSKGYVHGSFGKRSRFTKPRGTAGGRRSTAPDAATSATSPKPSRPSRSPESFSSPPRPESGSASTEADELTTFERKITLLDRPADLPKPTDDVRDAALNGYRFVDVSAVKTLVSALLCPNYHGNELDLKESGVGASLQFVVVCRACGEIVTTPQSATVGETRQSELSARLCVIGKDCGISFTKLKNLFGGMNAQDVSEHCREGARSVHGSSARRDAGGSDRRGTCESRCLESGVSTDPEPCGLARPRMAVRGFPVSGEKGILVVEPSPGAKKMGSDDLLVEVSTKQQSDALLKLNLVSDYKGTSAASGFNGNADVFGRPASPITVPLQTPWSGASGTASEPQGECCFASIHPRTGDDVSCSTSCFDLSGPGRASPHLCSPEEAWGSAKAVDLQGSTARGSRRAHGRGWAEI
ncbi:hypothetical protein HPB47_014364 [Ixodes persulcatus]|uniref:Uncharacterized protein n=1 Tax=Ixodes persulcatus TaxID=34615 RepID=A0AC60QXK0_IXOPE|nr:hypothetical protein HPB47_014364 [Ixodes persulcatus]